MKFNVISDLHLEFAPYPQLKKNENYIIAGDLGTADEAITFLEYIDPSTTVYYVAGNHEFYGKSFPFGYEIIRDALDKYDNIHFMERDSITIEDGDDTIKMFGCTLWTDLKLGNDYYDNLSASRYMNDYWTIKHSKNYKLTPQDIETYHYESLDDLELFLDKYSGYKTIVITHHLPTPNSISERYEDSPLNCYFASNLNEMIEKREPTMWVHGHTHSFFNYKLGKTEIVCNPRGYPNESHGYKEFTIEI